jgi:hypothetical protein
VGKYFGLIVCTFLFVFPAIGDAKMRALYDKEVKAVDVDNYYKNIVKTRPLTASEKELHDLSIVAHELSVETFLAPNSDVTSVGPHTITVAMIKNMRVHPKWDVPLDSKKLVIIKPYSELLKTKFGAKSYGWAWLVNQQGNKVEAKKILERLFEEGFQNSMRMDMLFMDGSSPLSELTYIQQALEPMSDSSKKVHMDSQMQKIKNHVSNLPASNIKT